MVVLNSKVLKCIFVSTKLPLVCLRQTGQWSVVLLPLKNSGSASITLKVLWLKRIGVCLVSLVAFQNQAQPGGSQGVKWCVVCVAVPAPVRNLFLCRYLPPPLLATLGVSKNKSSIYDGTLRMTQEARPSTQDISCSPLGQCDMVLLTPSRPNRSPSPLPGSIDP